ncbi:30S ribosomal protein S13 [Candidatus Microgenomates bacterium]|nr:30S ribosomal protein S13 [Candidatus Microgenomates bacterium]
MARIAGVELPENARVDYALTLLYGVGWPMSRQILTKVNIPQERRVKELTDEQINHLTKALEGIIIEGDLQRSVREDIGRLVTIKSYRGVRHQRGLPVRGQRTRTNARTKRGKRRTVGAFKKETLAKMQTRQPASVRGEQTGQARQQK